MFPVLLFLNLAQQGDTLTMDAHGAMDSKMTMYAVPVRLSTRKPLFITKEPTYLSTPRYGLISLGNGPNRLYAIACDEPSAGNWKIYVDKNQNGDFTDDGDAVWTKGDMDGKPTYGPLELSLNASYGTWENETSTAPYTVSIYRPIDEADTIYLCRHSARTGMATIDGKRHKVMLIENNGDGLYSWNGERYRPRTNPVWMRVDMDDDGKFDNGEIDIRNPFRWRGRNYEAVVAPDGSTINLREATFVTYGSTYTPSAEAMRYGQSNERMLKVGDMAPDFSVPRDGEGNPLTLQGNRGKILILNFWSSDDGTSGIAMRHLRDVYFDNIMKNVSLVNVNIWDTQSGRDDWMRKMSGRLVGKFGMDSAGRLDNSGIAAAYGITSAPTVVIIDQSGRIADIIEGTYTGDTRVDQSIRRLTER